jgi:hypothetical protein
VAEGIRKRQPNKDNCTFGSVFNSNLVLELEPKVSNYRNVALVVLARSFEPSRSRTTFEVKTEPNVQLSLFLLQIVNIEISKKTTE